MDLLGSVLEHANIAGGSLRTLLGESEARHPRREEVQARSPAKIEAMRDALGARDAALLSVLASAGLRPGEALGLRWEVRERTILIQRSISLGEETDTKTRQHRTVRLLTSLGADMRVWRMAAGGPVIASSCSTTRTACHWTLAPSVLASAGIPSRCAGGWADPRSPYDLRLSYVIDELDDTPLLDAEAAIRPACAVRLSSRTEF
jgi:integrase